MKIVMILLCAFSLTACGVSGGIPAPASVSNQTKLDEKAGIAVETMYTAVTQAGSLAYRLKVIPVSTNPLVHQDGFCALVVQGNFTPTDLGSRVNTIECKLRRARDLTRQAYDASNADSYDRFAREAVKLGEEFLALIRSR